MKMNDQMEMTNPREPESQSNEWKASWHDEYFKWLCGYANVGGGHLFVGVNDDGFVVGLKNFRRLLEELPNQIKTKMGIIAEVRYHRAERLGVNIRYGTDGTKESNKQIPAEIRLRDKNQYAAGIFKPKDHQQELKLKKWQSEEPLIVNQDGSLDYLEIVVAPYPHMVSCDGKVYKRSGSTLQELNGIELEKFILERSGRTWDEVIMPTATVGELDDSAFDIFRQKARRGRDTVIRSEGSTTDGSANKPADISKEEILRDLKCVDAEGHLCRAALLFFHPDPEQYVTGAFISIGSFDELGEIVHYDTVRGPLLMQVDTAVELIYSKYMKAQIIDEESEWIETYFWPREAFREVVLNAVINKDYQSGNPIQIKVHEDGVSVFNEGRWPLTRLTPEDVYKEHASYPANPKIANLFFAAGETETWGVGFSRIRRECEKAGAPLPIIEIGEDATPDKGVTVYCKSK